VCSASPRAAFASIHHGIQYRAHAPRSGSNDSSGLSSAALGGA